MNKKNSINVDEIPAGWGIDGLVAQRFLGWTKGNPVPAIPYTFYWHSPTGETTVAPPLCSTHMDTAMAVVEKLYELGWKFGMTQNSDREVVIAFVPKTEGYDPMKAVKARVVSIQLAALGICRAALLVAEKLKDEERITLIDEEFGDSPVLM